MAKDKYDSAVELLSSKIASTRCNDLISLMESFDFIVKPTRSGKHYVFTHKHFAIRGDFNGGHGADAVIKKPYIKDAIKAIKNLKSQLGTKNDIT